VDVAGRPLEDDVSAGAWIAEEEETDADLDGIPDVYQRRPEPFAES